MRFSYKPEFGNQAHTWGCGKLGKADILQTGGSRIEMGGDICLRISEIVRPVFKVNRYEAAASTPGSLDTVGRRSVGHFNE